MVFTGALPSSKEREIRRVTSDENSISIFVQIEFEPGHFPKVYQHVVVTPKADKAEYMNTWKCIDEWVQEYVHNNEHGCYSQPCPLRCYKSCKECCIIHSRTTRYRENVQRVCRCIEPVYRGEWLNNCLLLLME
jgi:hypothetical protein